MTKASCTSRSFRPNLNTRRGLAPQGLASPSFSHIPGGTPLPSAHPCQTSETATLWRKMNGNGEGNYFCLQHPALLPCDCFTVVAAELDNVVPKPNLKWTPIRQTRHFSATKTSLPDTMSVEPQIRNGHSWVGASATRRDQGRHTNVELAPRSVRASGATRPVARRHGLLAAAARPRRGVLPVGGLRGGPCRRRMQSRRAPRGRGRSQG